MFVTVALIIMDIFWCLTMRQVWSKKPSNNKTTWTMFNYLRSFTLILSWVNIFVKAWIVGALTMLLRKLNQSQ